MSVGTFTPAAQQLLVDAGKDASLFGRDAALRLTFASLSDHARTIEPGTAAERELPALVVAAFVAAGKEAGR